jgi:hypothetical protein
MGFGYAAGFATVSSISKQINKPIKFFGILECRLCLLCKQSLHSGFEQKLKTYIPILKCNKPIPVAYLIARNKFP